MRWIHCLRSDGTLGGEQRWPFGVGNALDGAVGEAAGVTDCLGTGLVVAGTLIASLYPATSCGQMVFGYYPGYRYEQMSPDKIDWSGINCVNHFAADPHGDGTLDLNRFQLFPSRIAQIVQLARGTDACVLLTIGGPETKWAFAGATANATVRARFVENIVNTVVEHGYDGIDIDWEPLQDSDETQFTAFIRDLRARLDAVVPGAILTVAVGYEWDTSEHKNTTSIVASVIDDLDFIHLIGYALAGPWDGWVTWHNSALFNGGERFPRSTKQLPSAEVVVEQYAAAGVPYEKLTLGLAFYGVVWQGGEGTLTGGVTAPRQSWTTPPSSLGEEYQYHQIIARSDFRANEHWDEIARTPYLSIDKPGAAEDLFIPYENPRSIREKVSYAATRGLGGLMIWELRGDYLPNNKPDQHPLLTALKAEYRTQYGALPGAIPLGPGEPFSDPAESGPGH
jgi:chitinase